MLKFDKKQFEEQKKQNQEERFKFVDLWCDYMKKVPIKEWSSQQAELINAQIRDDMI